MTFTAAVIGLGRIGAQFELERLRPKPASHLAGWKSIEDVNVRYGVDPDTSKWPERGDRDDPEAFRSYSTPEEMFEEHGQFDIVSVATPTPTHAKIVVDIAQKKQARLIFVEKPIAATVSDANSMIAACHAHGIILAVNHTRRWEPVWRQVISRLSQRAEGHPVAVTAYYTGDPLNVGIHMADVLNWLKVDEACVHNLPTDFLVFELDVMTTQGRFRISDHMVQPYGVGPSLWYEGIRELFPLSPETRIGWNMGYPCRQLVDCLKNGTKPYCLGEDGLAALQRVSKWRSKDGNGH